MIMPDTSLPTANRRILVIDDNPSIQNDFRTILVSAPNASAGIDAEAAAMFGGEPVAAIVTDFELDSALQDIEAVLATEEPRTKTGDPAKLKAATAHLDEVTKPLADHAMDKAMEAMLRKRGLISDAPVADSSSSKE